MRWCLAIASVDARDGGPSRGVLEVARALVREGHDVTVLAMQRQDGELASNYGQALDEGVEVVFSPAPRERRFRFSVSYLRFAVRLAKSADVVSIHGFYQWPCVAAWLGFRASSRATVLSFQPHGVLEPYQEITSRRFKAGFRRLVGDRLLRDVDVVVSASRQETDGLRTSAPFIESKIALIGLGTDSEKPRMSKPDRFDSRRVLFLSRIAPKKRLDKLLTAVALLGHRGEPVELVVCGDGGELLPTLLEMDFPRERVEFVGHVAGEQRSRIEESSALFCLPSDNENFGQAITEAMAAGLPVVTTSQCGASDHVLAADAGWVLDSPSAADLADAIATALADPDLLRGMSERAHAYAVAELSWDAVARRWAEAVAAVSTSG